MTIKSGAIASRRTNTLVLMFLGWNHRRREYTQVGFVAEESAEVFS